MDRQRIFIALILTCILLGLGGWLVYSAVIRAQNTFPAGSPPLDLKNSVPKVTVDMPKMRPPAIRNTDFVRYGGPTSSASLILFGNYDCADCKTLDKTIRQVLPKYHGAIRYVWRDLPADGDREQMNAAVFAACAGVQGKYWQAHDALLAAPALDEFVMTTITTQLKLDQKALNSCRLDPTAQATIWTDANAVGGDGVTSTPILFIGTEATKDILTPTELEKRIKLFVGS
ncbi:thioredoxin domain-containing protein [Candidatus Uhrbacteria bacterium]|nr:thioredoxin domain-containing protein [Candidatus Uhrbacteria bacterium]